MRVNKTLSLMAASALAVTGTHAVQAALNVDQNMAGQWFEVGESETRGWNLQVFPAGPEAAVLFAVGFVYDADGNPFWVAGNTFIRPSQFDVDIPLQEFTGGDFGNNPGNPVGAQWGNLNIEFHDCNNATFSWSGNADIADGSAELQQIPRGYGQCVYQTEFEGCPNHPNVVQEIASERACVLQGTIEQDLVLTNDTTWLLNGGVFIGDKDADDNDVNVWVEPGTRILGIGSGGADLLTVSRGGKLYAEGQPYAPIVFSSANFAESALFPEETAAAAGDWGGLVVNGFATINVVDGGGGTALGEGDSGTYGGTDDNDSSGVLRYARVQFAGNLITDLDELNGIAFQGTGAGTVVDNVQVHANSDDGIEFFGGTVNVRRVVLTAIQDDSLDWTQGYRGNIQYGLVVQQQSDQVETDRGMEMDNFSNGQDNEPRSQPAVSHITLIGNPEETGMTMRAGTGGNFSNMIVYGFSTCIDIDEASTFTAAGTPNNLSGVLTMENSIVMCETNFKDNETETDDNDNPVFTDPWLVSDWYNAQPNNTTGDPGLVNGLFPEVGSPTAIGFPLDSDVFGEWFEDVDHIGAFSSEAGAWHYQWTEFIAETLP